MQIYNKEPILVLWDIVKTLTTIPIYKEVMTEDENSIPNSYILLRSGIIDNDKTFGDGKTLIRKSECDIILISKGSHPNTTDLHNVNIGLIKSRLKALDIPYKLVNVGFSSETNTTTTTWTIEICYV